MTSKTALVSGDASLDEDGKKEIRLRK